MVNIHDKLIDELSDSELKLLLVLARYGKKSAPKNDVLLYRTGWGGINKLQKNKKALIDKGLIQKSNRFKKVDGKNLRDSNSYQIVSELISTYNSSKQVNNYELISFEVLQNEVVQILELISFESIQNEVLQFEVLQNESGIKLLKSLFIKIFNSLKEKERERDELLSLKKENEILKKQLSQLESEKKSFKEKNSAKKESSLFPDITAQKTYKKKSKETEQDSQNDSRDKRVSDETGAKKPFSHDLSTARQSLDALFPDDNERLKKEYAHVKGIDLTEEQIAHSKDSFIKNLRLKDKLCMINHILELERMFLYWWIEKDLKYQERVKNEQQPSKKSANSKDEIIDGINLYYSKERDAELRKRYS